MKQFLFLLAIATLAFTYSCKQAPEGQKVSAEDAKETMTETAGATYAVNTSASNVAWTGSKPAGKHTGNMSLTDGKLMVADGNITGGEFTIDMGSLTVTDLEGEYKTDLEGHLKNEDFFNVAVNPTSKFVITGVTAAGADAGENVTHNISGNLMLMGKTKSITFPANVIMANGKISAVTPPFTINRTDWDVKYGSGIIGTAQDKLIHDEIGLVINLEASPAQM